MNVKKAMQERNLKYFSGLTPKQKDNTVKTLKIIVNGLYNLDKNLALTILKNRDLDIVIKENTILTEKLKGQKMFIHNGVYIPLDIKKIISEFKA